MGALEQAAAAHRRSSQVPAWCANLTAGSRALAKLLELLADAAVSMGDGDAMARTDQKPEPSPKLNGWVLSPACFDSTKL